MTKDTTIEPGGSEEPRTDTDQSTSPDAAAILVKETSPDGGPALSDAATEVLPTESALPGTSAPEPATTPLPAVEPIPSPPTAQMPPASTASAYPAAAGPLPGSIPAPQPAPMPMAPTFVTEKGPRLTTVIWGLIIAVIGLGAIGYAIGFRYDIQLAVIILIAAAGVALLIGAITSAARKRT